MSESKRLVSKKELKSVYGIPYSPQHIARLEKAGSFPTRIRLGPNRVAWRAVDVEDWIDGAFERSRAFPTARAVSSS